MKRTKHKLHPSEVLCPFCGRHFIPKKPFIFSPPSIHDVAQYAKHLGYVMDGKHFVNYHTSAGWKVGKKSMVSWKGAIRTWIQNSLKWGDGQVQKQATKTGIKINVGFQRNQGHV